MSAIADVDHVMIAVPDLDGADRALNRLGFRQTARGIHSAHMGTANATVPLSGGTYLETLGILTATPRNAEQRRFLQHGPGLYGVAFKTDDAPMAAAELAAAGSGDGAIEAFDRPVDADGMKRRAAFTVAGTRPEPERGAWLFVCQHHTPDLVWPVGASMHPNAAENLVRLIGTAPDVVRTFQSWSVLGSRVTMTAEEVRIISGTADLVFLHPVAYARQFGPSADLTGPARLRRIELESLDLARTRACLMASGLAVETEENRLLVLGTRPEIGLDVVFGATRADIAGPRSPAYGRTGERA